MFVDINNDVSQFKEKMIYGLTLGQLIIGGLAVVTEVAVYVIGSKILHWGDFAMTLAYALAVIPYGAALVAKYNNMTFKKLFKVIFKYYFLQDKHLVMQNTNTWHKLNSRKGDSK